MEFVKKNAGLLRDAVVLVLALAAGAMLYPGRTPLGNMLVIMVLLYVVGFSTGWRWAAARRGEVLERFSEQSQINRSKEGSTMKFVRSVLTLGNAESILLGLVTLSTLYLYYLHGDGRGNHLSIMGVLFTLIFLSRARRRNALSYPGSLLSDPVSLVFGSVFALTTLTIPGLSRFSINRQ